MRRDYWLIAGLALLFFLPCLGSVHLFDWDEINFAECAREMLLTGDWFRPQVDFEPFWEKPPLFFWFQAASMSIFGVGEFAARLPNALCGVATLLLVYRIGTKLYDPTFGKIWALAWLGSLLPHFYFRSGIIDPWFNFFTFCGLYGFVLFRWQFLNQKGKKGFWARYKHLIAGGILLGLAVLTKGPTALLIMGLVLGTYWAYYKFKGRGYLQHMLLYFAGAGVAGTLWFAAEMLAHGPWFISEFVRYQWRLLTTPDAGHAGFFGYHVVVLLLGCFPISVFALPNLWGDRQTEEEVLESETMSCCLRCDFTTWMQILFWTVLVLFSLVQTKIIHYSSMAYFPLTYLGSVTIWRAMQWETRTKMTGLLLPALGATIGLAAAVIPYVGLHPEWLRPLFTRDKFALANLNAAPDWHLWQGLPGLLLAAASVVGAFLWQRGKAWAAVQTVFTSSALFISMTLMFIVDKIECYSQRAAIEFYEKRCGERCFVKPIGFKSYAHLYYACKEPFGTEKTLDDTKTLLEGIPDRTVYFVAKVNKTNDLERLAQLPKCRELYRKNGFVFFQRDP